MIIEITTKTVSEKSAAGIQIAFKDTDGNAVTPNSGLTWTLTDTAGTVVNSREDESISESTTITVPLSGNDLAIQGTAGRERRVLTLEGTYNDGTLGNNMPIKLQVIFTIEDLIAVT